jgi:uncharacterized coiled-coil protein SlyX
VTAVDRRLHELAQLLAAQERRIDALERELTQEINRLNDELDRICRGVGIPLPTADDAPAAPVEAAAPGAHGGGNGN